MLVVIMRAIGCIAQAYTGFEEFSIYFFVTECLLLLILLIISVLLIIAGGVVIGVLSYYYYKAVSIVSIPIKELTMNQRELKEHNRAYSSNN